MPSGWVYKTSIYFNKDEKRNIDFIFDQFLTPFGHNETRTNCRLYKCYSVVLHHRAVFFYSRFLLFLSFNRKQMVALFRLSPIQLTHCKLLLYNRLVRTNEYIRFILAWHTRSGIILCVCVCVHWNVSHVDKIEWGIICKRMNDTHNVC